MKNLKISLIILLLLISYGNVKGKDTDQLDIHVKFRYTDYYPGTDIIIPFDLTVKRVNKERFKIFGYTAELYRIDSKDYSAKQQIKDESIKFILRRKGTFSLDRFSYRTSDYKLNLGKLKSGSYLLTFKHPEGEQKHYFNVSRGGIITKFDFEKLVVFVQDRKTGEPIKSQVHFLELKTTTSGTADTDENGLAVIELPENIQQLSNPQFLIEAYSEGDYIPPFKYSFEREKEQYKTYIYTDRPAYRPGQKVYVKAIIRKESNGKLSVAKGKEVILSITDPKRSKTFEKKLKTDSKGSIDVSFVLDSEASLGTYNASIDLPGGKGQSFSVEEYRKPEFKIQVTPNKKVIKQNEEIRVKIKASYYFGKPVSNASFSYTVTGKYKNPYSGSYPNSSEFIMNTNHESNSDYELSELYLNNNARINSHPYPTAYSYYRSRYKNYANGYGTTDKNGEAEIIIKPQEKWPGGSYQFNVRIKDDSDRNVTGTGTFNLDGSDWNIKIETNKALCALNDKVKIVCRLDSSGNNNETIPARITVIRRMIGKNQYINEKLMEKYINLSKEHPFTTQIKPRKPGYYIIYVNAFNVGTKEVSARNAFLASAENVKHPWYEFNKFHVITGKKNYYSGETADVLIANPHPEMPVLFTIEGEKVFYQKVLKFDGNSKFIRIPIKKSYAPNVFFTISYLKDMKCNVINQSFSKSIKVTDRDKKLKVKVISSKKTYKPAETAQFKIRTTSLSGSPLSALVTFGIVDESLYAMFKDSTPNIFDFFYKPNDNRVYTHYTGRFNSPFYTYNMKYSLVTDGTQQIRWYEIDPGYPSSFNPEGANPYNPYIDGPATYGDVPIGFFIRDPFGHSTEIVPVIRKDFPDTGYFNPDIITDENGEATINVKLPDTLTTWRGTAKGVTDDTKAGETKMNFTTDKKLLVRLIAPRFIRERDELEIKGIIHSYHKSTQKVKVDLEVEGVELQNKPQRKITLKTGENMTVRWKIKADKAGKAILRIKAVSSEDADAMELSIPVLPHGIDMIKTISGVIKNNDPLFKLLSINNKTSNNRVSITLNSSIASSLIPSLKYLKGFPYGCVEQTMSRFLPTIEVSNTIKMLSLKDPELSKDIPEMVRKGFNRLEDFQHNDGGWGWWKNDDSNLLMTAYVVYGMTRAEKAGFKINGNYLQKGFEYLKEEINSITDYNKKAYVFFALSETGSLDKTAAADLFSNRDKLNNYGRAVAAIAYHNFKMKKEASELADLIESKVSSYGDSAFWEADKTDGWMKNRVETTAWNVLALLRIKPESQLVLKGINYIISQKQGHKWHTTKDTAAAVFALTEYMKTIELENECSYKVMLNNEDIKSGKFNKDDLTGPGIIIDIPAEKLKKTNQISIAGKGGKSIYYSILNRYYSTEKNIMENSSGIRIKRTYYLAKTDKTEKTSKRHVPLKSGSSIVKTNDRILVRLTVENKENYEYVIIEDPIPSGFEFLSKITDKAGYNNFWYTHQENRDEKKVLFLKNLYNGTHEFQYYITPEVPGTFHAMPATAATMYTPGIRGNSDEMVIEVTEK